MQKEPKYTIEVFDSHNTCLIKYADTIKLAHRLGGNSKFKYVIYDRKKNWEEFTVQKDYVEQTAWSYPHGLKLKNHV